MGTFAVLVNLITCTSITPKARPHAIQGRQCANVVNLAYHLVYVRLGGLPAFVADVLTSYSVASDDLSFGHFSRWNDKKANHWNTDLTLGGQSNLSFAASLAM